MRDLCRHILGTTVDLFRSRAALEAERLVLRQQIIVLRRRAPKKLPFGPIDKLMLAPRLPILCERAQGIGNCQSGNGRPLAPCRISIILALDVEEPSWSTGDPV